MLGVRPVQVSVYTDGLSGPTLKRLPGLRPVPAPRVEGFGTFYKTMGRLCHAGFALGHSLWAELKAFDRKLRGS